MSDDPDAGPVETAREFFSTLDSSLLAGAPAEWARWQERDPTPSPYEHTKTVDRVELLEQTGDRAVVDVRAEDRARVPRGTFEWRTSFDGPAVLERTPDGWRVVDYTLNGRRRSESTVLGPLAEQHDAGLTVRVLGVDRGTRSTAVLAEIVNDGAEPVLVDRALIMLGGVWRRIGINVPPVEPGRTTTVAVVSPETVELTQQALTVGFRARSGRRRSRFLMHAPLIRPNAPFVQPMPRRWPLLQESRAGLLALYAVAAAATFVLAGWFALVVPMFVVLLHWRHWRAIGRLPEGVYPFRHLFDVLVVGGCLVVAWLSPAPEVATTLAAGLVAYGALRLARAGEATCLVVALSAATTWIALVGGSNDRLSPCRLADGTPARTADTFVRAVVSGDTPRARRLEADAARRFDPLLPHAVAAGEAQVTVAARRPANGDGLCRAFGGLHAHRCYTYTAPPGRQRREIWVAIGCETRRWRVEAAF